MSNTNLELLEIDSDYHIIYAMSDDTFYVYFRGTDPYDRQDITENLRLSGTDFEGMGIGFVHSGYYNRSLQADLNSVYERARKEKKNIIISGHSLGGGSAIISTMMLLNRHDYNFSSDDNINIMCVTYGTAPCVDEKIRDYIYSIGYKDRFLNIFFKYDFITNLINPFNCSVIDNPENIEGYVEFCLRKLYTYITTPISYFIRTYICKYCYIGNFYNIQPVFWHGSICYIQHVYEFLQRNMNDQSFGLIEMY